MIAGLEPYPATRDSGVPWLGHLPQHWSIVRLKTLFREVDRRSGTGTEPLLSLRMEHGLVDHHEMGGTPIPPASLTHYKVAMPGEIVMNRMRAASGLFGVPPKVGLVSPDYAVLRPQGDISVDYFVSLFRTPSMRSVFRLESRGLGTGESGFMRLYTDRFGTLAVPLPSPGEQAAIVRFLAAADARIRMYIRAKQKLIALLAEQKQAVVHQAVTRGLDTHVSLKPSGVEWIGDIPAHWESLRLKTLVTRIDQGISPAAENRLAGEDSWGVVKAGCVNHGVFREHEHKRLPDGFDVDRSLAIDEGDVILSRASGSPNLVGSVARVTQMRARLILSDKTFRLVFRSGIDPDFMVRAMNSRYYRLQVERAISGASGLANNLPLSSLRAFRFAIPPVEEQRAIVEYLEPELEVIRGALERAERGVALLLEYRLRLIVDVVTGKLDVREPATRLSLEVDRSVSDEIDVDTSVDFELEEIEGGADPEFEGAEA